MNFYKKVPVHGSGSRGASWFGHVLDEMAEAAAHREKHDLRSNGIGLTYRNEI